MTDVCCDENVLNLTVLGCSIFIRYMYVNAHLMSLILGGHSRESIWLQTVLSFFTSHRCVYWCQFQLPTWRLAVTSRACQPITHLLRHTKEMSVIDEPAHVAVRLQLLEMSSITTPIQIISNVCTRYKILRALFRKNIGDFYRYATMKKFSMVIVCKRNCFDF